MIGKEKCELLKNIRRKIAEMNGIDYYPEPCFHEGDCPGFCPRCDQEAAFLMAELKKKEAAGSPIRIDTESIGEFENMINTPVEEEQEETAILGMEEMKPEEREVLLGEPDPISKPRFFTMGIVDHNTLRKEDYDNKDEEVQDESEPIDYTQFLKDNRKAVKSICGDCARYRTIKATEDGIRCSCLSEHFFLKMFEKGTCSLKKLK